VNAPGTNYCTNPDPNAAPCSQFASNKCIMTQVVCNHDGGNRPTGGVWTGTSPLPPQLVK